MRQPRVFHLLQKAHNALFRAADHVMKKHLGLTASQQTVLLVLMKRDGAPITAIADELRMGKSSLTGLVDRMQERGLVRRERSATDGRSLEVYIEEPGRRIVLESLAGTKTVNSQLLAPFSNHDRAVIERFLNHVAENAEMIVTNEAKMRFGEKVST